MRGFVLPIKVVSAASNNLYINPRYTYSVLILLCLLKQNAGSYAVDFNSTEFNLPSGIYFYTLNAGEFKETRKMVLVK